jgi:hypothetical protein
MLEAERLMLICCKKIVDRGSLQVATKIHCRKFPKFTVGTAMAITQTDEPVLLKKYFRGWKIVYIV